MCVQPRLWPTCESTQFGQSLLYALWLAFEVHMVSEEADQAALCKIVILRYFVRHTLENIYIWDLDAIGGLQFWMTYLQGLCLGMDLETKQ